MMNRFDADKVQRERREREARRATIRNQMLVAQQTNAGRDAKALAREAAWFRKNRQAK